MKIKEIHPLNIGIEKFETIQSYFFSKISLNNTLFDKRIRFCAGVDLAYWEEEG
ncbi:hypothetical protein [Oceanobacillus polygoni]|uniref:Deoxyinosine 3'endonuclease (Endonuclease V) n=1 Tax=Oceanobacillus polygoni TaxID=1235259 RepID=A0A9X0Z2F7_9BACI|nr:hypothetical protein [Oceanobacillus polygoni]MBP2080105.1 deoxyinosine 3'endonuclease (endonuclease V) [Oceanobacillus polygoni]